jgi:hypothetical protein
MEPVKLQAFLAIPAAAAATNWFFVLTNKNAGSLLFRSPNAPRPGSEPSRNHPAPGVYEGAPYKCIVVVPGPQQDDRCIIGLGAAQSRMLTITPDLELIPRKSK